MPKLVLAQISNVGGNPAQVALTLNENFTRIAEAFENTLSLDGTEPNQLEGNLDLNSYTLSNAVLDEDVTVVGAE